MIDFKLEDWVPMSPLAGPPLPLWMHLYWPWYKPTAPPGTEFKVSDLVISPAEVNPGQPVTISCTVTNIGAEAGDYTVKMGGDFVAEQVVELTPSESKVVSFEAIPHEARTYQVSVNGLAGNFVSIAPTQPFTFSNLSVQRVRCQSATAWNTLNFGCTITNPTDKSITHILTPMYRSEGKSGYSAPYPSSKYARELTLSPGQSYDYYLAGSQPGRCTMLIGFSAGVPYGGCAFLRDETGNDSPQACL